MYYKFYNGRYRTWPYNTEKLKLQVTWQIFVKVSQKKAPKYKNVQI